MGPCGVEFREAFSCFHYSEEEPKGKECLPKFADMQECMKQYPELYEEKKTDKEEEKEEEKEKEKAEEPKAEADGAEVKDTEVAVVTEANTKDEEDAKPEAEISSVTAEEAEKVAPSDPADNTEEVKS